MTFCPHCGFSLDRDEPIERDGFTIDPRGSLSFLGEPVRMTRAEVCLMHTVASANGRIVSRSTVGERVGDQDDPANVASVLLCRVRKRLREISAPCPVVGVHGRGYRWERLA